MATVMRSKPLDPRYADLPRGMREGLICQLFCGRPAGKTVIGGVRICDPCAALAQQIAADAGRTRGTREGACKSSSSREMSR